MNDNNQPPAVNKCVGSPCANCPKEDSDQPIYSHQLQLVNAKNLVELSDIPYSICEEKQNSHTDKKGKTARIYTEEPQKLSFLVGKLATSWHRRGGSFGSLQHTDERTIKLKTDLDHPSHKHLYTEGYDYIVVAGAPNDVKTSTGNRYRFINHGIKELQKFRKPIDDESIRRIFIVFENGTTETDRERIKKYTEKLCGQICFVKNVSEFIEIINQRLQTKRLIKKLVFYCHGTLHNNRNCLSFHYRSNTSKDNTIEEMGAFYESHVKEIKETIFDHDAKVISYACRNGISEDGKDLTGKEAGQKKSIAQKMADHWDVEVQAYEMRSDYEYLTYGGGKTVWNTLVPFTDDSEIVQVRNYGQVIEKYEKEMDEYQIKDDAYSTQPVKPDNYDEIVLKYQDLISREKFENEGNGPIMSHGAWHDPTTGDTPKGLKSGLQPYQPQEWK